VPFFWSQHYDVPINYVGHAERWDEIVIDGDITAKDCLLKYKRKGADTRSRFDIPRSCKPAG
jgi:apoptosis-inducing factor 3